MVYMSRELKYRHHEEVRLKLHDPENETFTIPLKHVDVMKQIQNSINSVSGNIVNDVHGPKRRVSIFPEEWTGTYKMPDVTVYVQDFLKDIRG